MFQGTVRRLWLAGEKNKALLQGQARVGAVRKLIFQDPYGSQPLILPCEHPAFTRPRASCCDQKTAGSFQIPVWLEEQDKDSLSHRLKSVYNLWSPLALPAHRSDFAYTFQMILANTC